jgi:hypothetical protein
VELRAHGGSIGPRRAGDPAADVVAEGYGTQELFAGAAFALGDREGRRNDSAAGVRERELVRVVGLVGMSRHGVGERGVAR